MKIRSVAFNTYLLAAALLLGCKSTQEKMDSTEARKQKKELSTIRVHLESAGENANRVIAAPVLRVAPIMVNVEADSFLDERDVLHASVADYMSAVRSCARSGRERSYVSYR